MSLENLFLGLYVIPCVLGTIRIIGFLVGPKSEFPAPQQTFGPLYEDQKMLEMKTISSLALSHRVV